MTEKEFQEFQKYHSIVKLLPVINRLFPENKESISKIPLIISCKLEKKEYLIFNNYSETINKILEKIKEKYK